jgi:imidazolonepropionase-like amidohydrolase
MTDKCIFIAAILGSVVLSPLVAMAQDHLIVLKVSTAYDGKGRTIRNTTIVVKGSKVLRIGGPVPTGAATYDLTALTVTPGWIDTHTHIGYHFGDDGRNAGRDESPEKSTLRAVENAVVTLNAGFTTIQSPGQASDRDLREAIARGIVPGPRVLTSLEPLTANSGPPDRLRELVRKRKEQGADLIKIFASKALREGGARTMTDEQLQAACGEAKAQGLRTIVHVHPPEVTKAVVLAGCTAIEHGAFITDDVFALMEQRGTYYDPNIGLELQNYLENKQKFFGRGSFTAEGFALMEKAVSIQFATFRRALTHKRLKIVYGTDAVAGAHGRNYEEFIARVRDGGQDPMAALESATSISAESLNLGDQIGSLAPGMQADIVGFDGDPLQDVNAARRAAFVMKGGKVYDNRQPRD